MTKLGSISGKEAVRRFEKAGFSVDKVKRSHWIMVKPGHEYHLCVPVHGTKAVKKGTMHDLIKAAGLTVKEFIALG